MTQKIAIAVVHGIGKAEPNFADPSSRDFLNGMAGKLRRAFRQALQQDSNQRLDPALAEAELVMEAVYWAPVLQTLQDDLDQRLGIRDNLSPSLGLRDFIFHSLADSIGYQITPTSRDIYDDVHRAFAQTIRKLQQQAGPQAPLCVIAHSMGSAIASNYLWDLQKSITHLELGPSPLEQGETFALFYTFGSQIAFWSLRYQDFGTPIAVPAPQLSDHYPAMSGEWINFFDRDDLLGYPIEQINPQYGQVVQDMAVNVGNPLTDWNILSHNAYWQNSTVIERMAKGLARVWRSANTR